MLFEHLHLERLRVHHCWRQVQVRPRMLQRHGLQEAQVQTHLTGLPTVGAGFPGPAVLLHR